VTAASSALRSCNYFQIGERFAVEKNAAALDAYRASLACFQLYLEHGSGPFITRVEVGQPGSGDAGHRRLAHRHAAPVVRGGPTADRPTDRQRLTDVGSET